MLSSSPMAATFSTNDIVAAEAFYRDVMGAEVTTTDSTMRYLTFESGAMAFVYEKDDHHPADHTVMTFLVPDIDAVAAELKAKGVGFEHLEYTGEDGIARGGDAMPTSAWIRDPAGNWICFTEGRLADLESR
jgi:catechol 2,3-dioxygenase-like lactoylglutathione lyase family enzyme